MKITKLSLRNIGAFYGLDNEFNLETTKDRNVILFGGKNGAGKTTLLESLRIVLFGSLAYGFMTDNEAYYNKIRTILNRTAFQNGESTYQIILHFSSVENYETIEYILNRSWNVKDKKIKESFAVQRSDKYLNAREIDNFQNKMREEMPPRLFELCLFDGEEISRIVSEGQIPHYLNDAGKVLFNLDLFVNLEKDLLTFRSQQALKEESTAEETQKVEIEQKLIQVQEELNQLNNLMSSNAVEIDQLRDVITEFKKDFETHGGLLKEQRQSLILKTNEIENIRKINSDKSKNFINELLPFFITRKLLHEVDTQMDLEKINESFEYVSAGLDINKVRELSEKIVPKGFVPDSEAYSKDLFEGILRLLKPENSLLIHRASFTQRSEVRSLHNQIEKIDPKIYHSAFIENAKLLEDARQLRKAIEENDRSSDFGELLNHIETNTLLLEQKRLLLEQFEEQKIQFEEQLKGLQLELEKVDQKLNDGQRVENSFAIAEKVLSVSQRFRTMQLRKKLDQVEQEARKMIQLLFRKKKYINRIHIDHETFELYLYGENNEELVKERLSAGEKEMLMLSVIWSMFRVSGWKLPFVFDTLLGRLDQDHKKELINQFIPKCGEQVIILSTDSEITPEQFRSIHPIMSRCYTLEFKEKENRAEIIKDNYFNMCELELT